MILVSDAGVLKISDRAEEARRLGDVLRAFDGAAVVRPAMPVIRSSHLPPRPERSSHESRLVAARKAQAFHNMMRAGLTVAYHRPTFMP
jgi:hypothetical protein